MFTQTLGEVARTTPNWRMCKIMMPEVLVRRMAKECGRGVRMRDGLFACGHAATRRIAADERQPAICEDLIV